MSRRHERNGAGVMDAMPDTADIALWVEKLEKANLPSRRTSPDLAAQLRQTLRRPVDRLLCIAADVDPSVDLLSSLARRQMHDIRGGLGILRQLVTAKLRLIDPRRSAVPYPHLDPTLLVRRYFNRRLRAGALPTEVGVLVIDAITAIQLAAIAAGNPVPRLPVVIDDRRHNRRLRLDAEAGESVLEVLRRADVPSEQISLLHGAPLQERELHPNTPIGKSELWIHVRHAGAAQKAAACTRCGECVTACPVNLHPAMLLEAAQQQNRAAADRFHIDACIECGLCSITCPSRLPLLASFRELKKLPA